MPAMAIGRESSPWLVLSAKFSDVLDPLSPLD